MNEIDARLGERLVEAGAVTASALENALALQKAEGGYLSDVLVDGGFVEEPVLLQMLADGGEALTAAQLSKARPASELLDSLPVASAERLCILPLLYDAKARTLTLVVPDLGKGFLKEALEVTGAVHLKPVMALHRAIRACIQRCYYNDPYAFVWLERRPATTQRIAQAADAFMARLTPLPLKARPPTLPPILLTPPAPVPAVPAGPPPGPDVLLKLHEELEASRREVQMLRVANDLSVYLARERNVFQLLQRVLAFAFDNILGDEGVLLLRDAVSKELRPCAFRTRTGERSEAVVSQTLVRQIEQTGQAVLATDAAYDAIFWQSKTVATDQARSLMGVPLVIGDKVEGAITLVTYGRAGAFSPVDLNVLSGIAAQTSIALENLTLIRRLSSDAAVRDRLARFLSPALVEAAATGELSLVESGQLLEPTILFADIRSFTSIAERLQPQQVVQLLNHHFELMTDIVFAKGGILDKYIGDGVMALWGIPVQSPGATARAFQAGLEMIERVRQLNEAQSSGRLPFDIGVGINTGPAVFGAIGAGRRMELTAVGDAVNIASRLCSMAGPGQVIVSESALRAAGPGFRLKPIAPVQLKGRSQAMPVFQLQGAD